MNTIKSVTDALIWLRDNKHHYSSWEPQKDFPNCTHMEIHGKDSSAQIPADVVAATHGMLRYDKDGHQFYPNEIGMKYIEDNSDE